MAKPYNSIISESKMELEVDLDELFGVKVPNNREFREAVGQAIVDKIVERTQSGNKLTGGKFKGYSESYKKSAQFEAFGKSPGEVDLTLTGDMLGTLDIKAQSRNALRIGWRDETQNAKAFNHHTGDTLPARPFFGLTDAEIKQIRDEFKDQVPQENNRGPQRLGDLLSSLTKIEKGEVG